MKNKTKKNISFYFIISSIIIVIDQISKIYMESIFLDADGEIIRRPIKVIGEEFFRLTLVYNPGVAFGIRLGGQYILSSISLLASIAIIIYMIKLHKENKRPLEVFAFSFVLGGAFGNFIDRVLYGKVIDFLWFDFPDFIMETWPVFNVADSFVTIGMFVLAYQYLVLDTIENKKEEKNKSV